ncbi:MAG: hypothetical protein M3552_18250 [Planctomycetota bacterium]|nr:hypothetical protein [Planctomycetaceae bacterium]MDQ3332561.1 hypothetical protein [Planctomycetota bacterium]
MLPPELRRSCGMLPGTELLCTSRSGMLCTGRLLPAADLLCSGRSDLLCSGCMCSGMLPGRPELLCSGRLCSGMLCSGRVCPGVRQRLRSDLPRQQLLRSEEEVLPEPPLQQDEGQRLPQQEQLPQQQRLLPRAELLCSDLCRSWRLPLIEAVRVRLAC